MRDNKEAGFHARVRTMQIIAGALPAGVIGFMIVAILVSQSRPPAGIGTIAGLPILSALAIAMLVIQAPLAFVVSRTVAEKGIRQGGDGAYLLGVKQTSLLILLAMFEGVAFLGCIAIGLEGPLPALFIVGLCLLIMLAHFPTESGVREWLEMAQRRTGQV